MSTRHPKQTLKERFRSWQAQNQLRREGSRSRSPSPRRHPQPAESSTQELLETPAYESRGQNAHNATISRETLSFAPLDHETRLNVSFDSMHRSPPSTAEHQVEGVWGPRDDLSAALPSTFSDNPPSVHQEVFEDEALAPFPTLIPKPATNNDQSISLPHPVGTRPSERPLVGTHPVDMDPNLPQVERETKTDSSASNIAGFGTISCGQIIGNVVVVSGDVNGTIGQNLGDVKNWLESLLRKLNIARKADYGYYADHQEQGLRRGCCTPGTRLSVIEAILKWALDTSSNCSRIFWLSGQGGAGKTTIAFTITKHFALSNTSTLQVTVLGGSFFCSRHSPETRRAAAIIPTIAYRLAVQSPAFREALKDHGDFDKVDHDPSSQFEALIAKPWKQCLQQRTLNHEPCFIISIDAIDELDPPGGTEFLETLIKVVEEHQLPGLKFFVTSRLEPALVDLIDSFANKQVCRLEQIPVEESNADIKLYLDKNLAQSLIKEEKALMDQLLVESGGLFIYAATVVDYLKGRNAAQQKDRLIKLLDQSSHGSSRLKGATAKLDLLYRHILETSLVDPRDREDSAISAQCLLILHTFLCTNERTSTTVAVNLLNKARTEDTWPVDTGEADELVRRLHAVLYIQDGQVLWFHKSFPDFIFDAERSKEFHCRQNEHHRVLVNGCFGVMRRELRFNMGDIPSSYQLDRDNAALANIVKKNISAPLSYACRSWSAHLTAAPATSRATILETLGDFLQLKVLFWMEAMNLLGCRGHCAALLRSTQKWAARPEELSSLQGDLEDAAAFAFHFSSNGAALSTPHLYISSLATFPGRSGLLSSWKQRFSGIPDFSNSHLTLGGGLVLSTTMADAVNAVAVSQDDSQIAIGLGDGTIRIRGLATGEELEVLRGHTGEVRSVAYSSDGKHIVSGSDDRSVRVWDALTGKQLASLDGHTDGVTSVAYSPNGKHIVSGSDDMSVRVWDASTGKQLALLEGHTGYVNSVAYSPESKHIVSGSDDSSVRVWDVSMGKQLASLEGHTRPVNSVAYSPDSKYIVSGSGDRSVQAWSPLANLDDIQYLRQKVGDVHTGWLLSPINPSQYLMFVPLSENLPDASNVLTIPYSYVAHLDLSKAVLGDCWTHCYSPDL